MELCIAAFVIVVGLMTMIGAYSLFYRMAVKSRSRIYAELVAKNMMERISCHHYGDPMPLKWTEDEVLRYYSEANPGRVTGTSQEVNPNVVTFKKEIKFENGSFIGKTHHNYDIVTVTITWSEASPEKPEEGEKGGYSSLVFTTEVRRTTPDQAVK